MLSKSMMSYCKGRSLYIPVSSEAELVCSCLDLKCVQRGLLTGHTSCWMDSVDGRRSCIVGRLRVHGHGMGLVACTRHVDLKFRIAIVNLGGQDCGCHICWVAQPKFHPAPLLQSQHHVLFANI